jgi:dGTPase
MEASTRGLRAFLFQRMYRHERVVRMTDQAKRVVGALFDRFFADANLLPDEWRRRGDGLRSAKTARVVADYIAGMTDRFALDEYRRLTGEAP